MGRGPDERACDDDRTRSSTPAGARTPTRSSRAARHGRPARPGHGSLCHLRHDGSLLDMAPNSLARCLYRAWRRSAAIRRASNEQHHFRRRVLGSLRQSCRPSIESACVTHLRRTGNKAIDLDDMISGSIAGLAARAAAGGACSTNRSRPKKPPSGSPASGMLAVGVHGSCSASRRSQRERATEDVEMVMELARSQSTSSRLERNEATAAALNELRSKLERSGAESQRAGNSPTSAPDRRST